MAEAAATAAPLLVLCCFGAQPFVDLHLERRPSHHVIDPTDWMASDTAGDAISNLTAQLPMVQRVLSSNIPLAACDLYNISFTTDADADMYRRKNGTLACRCPSDYSGVACETPPSPRALPVVQSERLFAASTLPSNMILIVGIVVFALFVITILIMRGCFCDCFGPMLWGCKQKKPKEPLDRECLQNMLNDYRQRQGQACVAQEMVHGIPSISEGMAAPYNSTIIVPPPRDYRSANKFTRSNVRRREPSPPPAYSSLAGSSERLSHAPSFQHTQI